MFVLVKFIGVKNMAKQAKVLNEKEISKLFKVCELTNFPVRNKLIVAFSFYGGLRAIEIANLNVSDILSPTNEVNDIIRLTKEQTKGSNSNTVHVGKKLQREILRFISKYPNTIYNKDKRLFQSQRGKFSSQSIQNLFRNLYQLANITNASSHSGRRTFITNLSEKGISTRVIQELARHSSMATTQRYIDVSDDKLKNAVNLI
jgi:integrase/recombinase XerD